jgi:hypothetical protein
MGLGLSPRKGETAEGPREAWKAGGPEETSGSVALISGFQRILFFNLATLPKDDYMNNTHFSANSNSSKTFSRLQITDLDALPVRDIHIFEPGILAEGYSHQIVAPYESGKTFLSLICAREFLKKGFRVLYLDHENRKSSIKERLGILGTNDTERGSLLYVNQPNLDLSEDSKLQWVDFLQHHKPALIIFDSLNGFLSNAGRDENSSTGFQEWANTYLKVPRRTEITTLVIDHTGWEGTHSRGTSRKPDEFDIVWNATVKEEFSRGVVGEIQLKAKKDRDSVITKDCLSFVIGGTPFQYEVTSDSKSDNDLSEDEQKTYDLIVQNSSNGVGTRRKDINQLFEESKSRADKTIKSLLKRHLIYQKGESSHYWTLDSILDSPSNAKSPVSPDQNSNLYSSEEEVDGEGVQGVQVPRTGPPDPAPYTNLEELLDRIDSIDRIEDLSLEDEIQGYKGCLKTIVNVCFENPSLIGVEDIRSYLRREKNIHWSRGLIKDLIKFLKEECLYVIAAEGEEG